MSDARIDERMKGLDFAALCERLERCAERAREAVDADDDRLAEIGDDLAIAATFASEADSYQRPDRYVFASTPLVADEVRAAVERVLERFPERRGGILGRLARFHADR